MPSALPLFRRSVLESWRGLLGWATGLTAVALLYLPLFPTFGGANSQFAELMDNLPPALVKTLGYEDIVSGAGYTQSTYFGLMAFVLVTIAAVTWGAAAIAGAEESGSLELTLAHGVSRTRQVAEAALSLLVRVVALVLLAVLLVLALNGPSELGLAASNVVAAGAALAGLGLLAGTTSLAVGAATGRHTWATAGGALVAVAGYAFNAVGNQAPDVEWLRALSPYAWAWHGTPLKDGWDLPGLAALWGASLLLAALAVWALERRDLRS